jgi:hypothetical protein
VSAATTNRRLRKLLEKYGAETLILKYTGTIVEAGSPYDEGEPVFDEPVTVLGRGILTPTKDTVSFLGSDERPEIVFLWTRAHLALAFPDLPDDQRVTTDDRVVYDGRLFTLVSVHRTGRMYEDTLLLAAVGKTLLGRARESAP